MKKGEIENLYERYSDEIYKLTPEELKATKTVLDKEETFLATLNDEQMNLWKDMKNAENKRSEIVNKKIFIRAYSLAIRLVIESLMD